MPVYGGEKKMMGVLADTLPVYKEWRSKDDDEGTGGHTARVL